MTMKLITTVNKLMIDAALDSVGIDSSLLREANTSFNKVVITLECGERPLVEMHSEVYSDSKKLND